MTKEQRKRLEAVNARLQAAHAAAHGGKVDVTFDHAEMLVTIAAVTRWLNDSPQPQHDREEA